MHQHQIQGFSSTVSIVLINEMYYCHKQTQVYSAEEKQTGEQTFQALHLINVNQIQMGKHLYIAIPGRKQKRLTNFKLLVRSVTVDE